MRPTDLADPAWLGDVVRRHHRRLGLPTTPAEVQLVDVRLKNPHRPESRHCTGWATVRVPLRGVDDPVLLLRSAGIGAPDSGGTPIPGLPLRAWRFPDDPGLPALAMLADPRRARALLPRDLAVDHVVETVRVVRWQPGTSATLCCVLSGNGERTVRYAKVLSGGSALRVDEIQRRLRARACDGLRVAEPCAVDPTHRVLWTHEVVGRPLVTALGAGARPDEAERAAPAAGRALAALHASGTLLPPTLLGRPVDPLDVAAEAAKKARKIAVTDAGLEPAVSRLVALARAVPPLPARARRPLHGDFHVDQVLLSGGELVLLDLDEMVLGDPALDLAELAVDLVLRRLSAATTERFLSAVGEGYERAGGTPPAPTAVAGYAAAELLNRCYRHLRRPVPGWRQSLRADLAVTDAVLAGSLRTACRAGEGVPT